jgi:hypothetical protein
VMQFEIHPGQGFCIRLMQVTVVSTGSICLGFVSEPIIAS